MALITDPDSLSQGASTSVSDMVFGDCYSGCYF